jgi:hypothetical protein
MEQKLGLWDRVTAPTPKFFKWVRNIGLILGAAGAAILSVNVGLPPILQQIAGYLVTGGAVAGAISQTAVDNTQTGE